MKPVEVAERIITELNVPVMVQDHEIQVPAPASASCSARRSRGPGRTDAGRRCGDVRGQGRGASAVTRSTSQPCSRRWSTDSSEPPICSGRSTAREFELYYQPIINLEGRMSSVGRGTRALESPGTRAPAPQRLHPARRGDRPDRCPRAMGPPRGVPTSSLLAASAPQAAASDQREHRGQAVPARRSGGGRLRGTAEAGLDPKCLVLEITESVLVHDVEVDHRRMWS